MEIVRSYRKKRRAVSLMLISGALACLGLVVWLAAGQDDLDSLRPYPLIFGAIAAVCIVVFLVSTSVTAGRFQTFLDSLPTGEAERLDAEYANGYQFGRATLTQKYVVINAGNMLTAISCADIGNVYSRTTIWRLWFIPYMKSYSFHIEPKNGAEVGFNIRKKEYETETYGFLSELLRRNPGILADGEAASV